MFRNTVLTMAARQRCIRDRLPPPVLNEPVFCRIESAEKISRFPDLVTRARGTRRFLSLSHYTLHSDDPRHFRVTDDK